jgi:hypothetical protein
MAIGGIGYILQEFIFNKGPDDSVILSEIHDEK